jgi:hypothetical protein
MKANQFLVFVLLSILSSSIFALERKTFCVWDPVGRNGPVVTFYSDVIPKAQAWGLDIRFEAYTDESVAANEFKAGRCEAVVLTSILSRQFVQFAGTMDAIGAISSQKGLELALATLARERAGKLMTDGNYEVVTTFPVGSMFAFVRDKSIDTIDDFAGKKLAILNGDPQLQKFADLAGASKVNVTLATFAGQFNNGTVDIVIMPALAYNTFELYHGLGEDGGIIDYRLYYGMLQTIAKRDQFPEGFGHKMRKYMLTRLKAMKKMVEDAEDEIPEKYWIKTSQFVKDDIDHFSKRVRLALRDENVNNPTALKLFWKIRCRLDRSRGECKSFPEAKIKREKNNSEKKQLQAKKKEQSQLQQRLKKMKLEQARLKKVQLEQAQLAEERRQEQLELERLKRQQQEDLVEEKQKQYTLNQERQVLEKKQKELELQQQKFEQEKLALEEEKLALEQEKQSSWWDFLIFWN